MIKVKLDKNIKDYVLSKTKMIDGRKTGIYFLTFKDKVTQ